MPTPPPLQADTQTPSASNARAIILMIVAMTTFAAADTLIRLASQTGSGVTSGQFITLQGVMGTIMFFALLKSQGGRLDRPIIRDRNIHLRTIGDIIAAVSVVTSLTLLPVGTVSAILQLQPLTVTVAAVFILGEKVGLHRWTAIIIGLVGGLIIMRPGLEGFESSSLLVLLGVIGLTIRDIYTRKLGQQYSSTAAVLLVSFALFPVGILIHYLMGDGRSIFEIEGLPLVYLLTSSTVGMFGYYVLVVAMRIGEISAIAPYRYSRLISAFLIAWLILGEVPDGWTIIGSLIVVLAGITVVLRERQLRSRSIAK